jgi:hypothetical protein
VTTIVFKTDMSPRTLADSSQSETSHAEPRGVCASDAVQTSDATNGTLNRFSAKLRLSAARDVLEKEAAVAV